MTIMSVIVKTSLVLQKQLFWLKFWAVLCMPLCCIGLSCIMIRDMVLNFAPKFKKIIAIYGGEDNLEILSEKIKREIVLFTEAVKFANVVVDATCINQNIKIIDVIFYMFPKIKNNLSVDSNQLYNEDRQTIYNEQIWERYLKLGGCYHVIVYGYIEYICMTTEPLILSTSVELIINKFITNSKLSSECLSHKNDAGFTNIYYDLNIKNLIEVKKKF